VHCPEPRRGEGDTKTQRRTYTYLNCT
jgi:hypothetical protein